MEKAVEDRIRCDALDKAIEAIDNQTVRLMAQAVDLDEKWIHGFANGCRAASTAVRLLAAQTAANGHDDEST